MFEAKFRLNHGGCWTCGLSKFTSEFQTNSTESLKKDVAQDIVEISLSREDNVSDIKEYFDNHDVVSSWNVLEEANKKLILQLFIDTSDKKHESVVYNILKNNCFITKKISIIEGYEIWTIAAPKKEMIKNALDDVQQFGAFKLLHIKKSTFDGFNFSEQQEQILKKAISSGYYEWPRKISAQDLAKKLNLNKATLLEHLRKAEIKVMNREFSV